MAIFTLVVLVVTLILFLNQRIRYDVTALLALLVLVLSGAVAPEEAFDGFAHQAVITVALMLIVSEGLRNAGVVTVIGDLVEKSAKHPARQIALLLLFVMTLSAFMNNIGALAILLPVAVQICRKEQINPSLVLMPMAFASLLGGMITVIGTPPNMIIAEYRNEAVGEPFGFFSFAPVGVVVSAVGLLFLITIGQSLLPHRKGNGANLDPFHIKEYQFDLRLPEGSAAIGLKLSQLENKPAGVQIVALCREGEVRSQGLGYFRFRGGDDLCVQGEPEMVRKFAEAYGLEIRGHDKIELLTAGYREVVIGELSPLIGISAREFGLRQRYGLSLIAVARAGETIREKLGRLSLKQGDTLLLFGDTAKVSESLRELRLVSLEPYPLRFGPSKVWVCSGVFALGITLATVGVLPLTVAMLGVLLGFVALKVVDKDDIKRSFDLPLLILLAAMIEVGKSLETTGAAELVAAPLLWIEGASPRGMMLLLMILTVALSNIINNAAAAVIMAPIALSVAQGVGVAVDPMLMAVCVAASTSFMTPIAHQSNLLVMNPGGYRFGDYFFPGLILTLVVVATSVVVIPLFWPF